MQIFSISKSLFLAAVCLKEEKVLLMGGRNSAIPDDGSVTVIGESAFEKCFGLSELVIPACITKIEKDAFKNCTKIISISVFGDASIGQYAFYGCSSLREITLSEGVKSIGSAAFWNCSALETVSIPTSTTIIDSPTFTGCSNLRSIIVAEGNPNYRSDANGVLYDTRQKNAAQISSTKRGDFLRCGGGNEQHWP